MPAHIAYDIQTMVTFCTANTSLFTTKQLWKITKEILFHNNYKHSLQNPFNIYHFQQATTTSSLPTTTTMPPLLIMHIQSNASVTPIYWITATSTTKPNVCNSYLPLTNVYLIIFHLPLFHHKHSFNIQTFLVRQLSLLRLTTVKKKSKTRSSSHW
jgi:hypothetical protein